MERDSGKPESTNHGMPRLSSGGAGFQKPGLGVRLRKIKNKGIG